MRLRASAPNFTHKHSIEIAPNVATSVMLNKCTYDYPSHALPMPFFLCGYLIEAQSMWIFSVQALCIRSIRRYTVLNAVQPIEVGLLSLAQSVDLTASCTFNPHHRKHRCIISIILSCCSGLILLSLGRQSPRRKISAPTSIPEPFI